MLPIRTTVAATLMLFTLGACGTAGPHEPVTPATGARQPAHELVMQATSCWMGGLWSDALGEKGDDRLTGIQQRCDMLMREVGASGSGEYYPLRVVDAPTVDVVAHRVAALAAQDAEERPHADELVALVRRIADATRETIRARRAADKVKADLATQPPDAEYPIDKIAAAPELAKTTSLHALLHADVGPYSDEAHVLGVMSALDRIEIARALPKHLKIYAVQGAILDVFGIAPPAVSDDAAAPIKTGSWLGYIAQGASVAGHPVAEDAKDPQNREPLAWNGLLEGFADKLRASPLPTTSPLIAVVNGTVVRLDEHYRDERNVFEALPPARR